MADNIQVTQGTGTTMATDNIDGVQFPRVKLSVGEDGTAVDVSAAAPMPVEDADANASLSSIDGKLPALSDGKVPVDIGGSGSITVTSGTVTANAGTNLDTSALNLEATQIAMSAKLPATLSQKTMAESLAVVLASDQSSIPVSVGTVAVTGPLTDSELRATALPVSASSLPLPTGASTESTLSALSGKIPSGLTVTGTRLQVELPAGGGGLTDTELRATPVPVSVSGVSTAANQVSQTDELTAIKTSVQTLDDVVGTNSGNSFTIVGGRHGSGADAVVEMAVDSQGNPQVDIVTSALPTGAATSANQTTANASLSSIDTKTPTLDNLKQPVIPSMTTGGNLSVTTAATGTDWTAYASQALKQLTISNQTEVTIEFRQGGAGVGFQVPTGAFYTFFGITNADQIEARRVDTSDTQVTVTARWES
jgi:hypothetical protein